MIVWRRFETELREDRPDVALDGSQLEDQRGCNGLVGSSLRHQAEDLALARCQFIEWRVVARSAEQLRDDLRIDHRSAGSNPPNGIGKLLHVGDLILEQVA